MYKSTYSLRSSLDPIYSWDEVTQTPRSSLDLYRIKDLGMNVENNLVLFIGQNVEEMVALYMLKLRRLANQSSRHYHPQGYGIGHICNGH